MLKKLKPMSLGDTLKAMLVGETAIAPDNYSPRSVRKTCANLKKEGYVFVTSTATEHQTITRIK